MWLISSTMFQCVKPFRSGRQQSEDGRPAGLWTLVIDHFFPFELCVLLCLEVFAACVNFLAPRPQIVELIRQYGLTTKARLPLGYVPIVQIVQYVQVVQRTYFGSDGLNVLNGLNYLNRLRAALYAFFAVKSSVWDGYSRPIICDLCVTSLFPFGCGSAALGPSW